MKGHFALFAAAFALCASAGAARAADVTIGYQLIYNPWKAAIADGAFEEATGYEIDWKRFDSGSKVITAMASGRVHVALAGSSPIAAGVSRGLPIELFWIVGNIDETEALVVRDGSGVVAPRDLRGKRLAVPFVSTAHFQTLFALQQFGLSADEVSVLNMQPPNIAAAWERGDIDAAFVWDPALNRIRQTGKVLVTAGQLSGWGKVTFDGMVVRSGFAAENPDFMCRFVATIAAADERYRSDPDAFAPGTDNARKIAGLVGGVEADVKNTLDRTIFPTLEQQASPQWLGGGAEGGAARVLAYTSEFLLEQRKIDDLQEDYAAFVNDSFVRAALAGC